MPVAPSGDAGRFPGQLFPMMGGHAANTGVGAPRLVVPYDLASFSPLQIADAADGRCELLWVITEPLVALGAMGALLRRLGTVVSVEGEDAVAAAAALEPYAPVGIVTFSHEKLTFAAALAAGLGLPFNDPASIRNCVDKSAQRTAMAAAGLATPRFAELSVGGELAEIAAATAGFPFPAVLKPRNGHGSLETYFVGDAKELVQLLEHGGRDGSPVAPGAYLLEQYLVGRRAGEDGEQVPVGDYVSVESLLVNSECRHLAVTGKFPLAEPFLETGNFMPSLLAPEERQAVEALATDVLSALGLTWGCLHTEIKLTPDGPRVIEVNPRVGGGGISDLFELRTGSSLMRLALSVALGETPEVSERPEAGVAYALYVQPPLWARELHAVEGLTEVSALSGVRQVSLNRQPPRTIDWREGSQGYVATVRGVAGDHAQLLMERSAILERLRPVYL